MQRSIPKLVSPALRSVRTPIGAFSPSRVAPRSLAFPPRLARSFSRSASTASSTTPPPPPPPPRRPNPTAEAYQRAREAQYKERNRSLLLYSAATILVVTAGSYLAVPLYRVFCSATGYGGTPQTDQSRFGPERLVPRTDLDSRIKVTFNADASDSLPWSFEPQQKEVRVLPGETALAFYTATNHSDEDIIGIATYNVTPMNIAPYFAKVECFCFEEQRLLAGEEVDLPVFFFIDRDFVDDPLMKDVREVTLSYTFLYVLQPLTGTDAARAIIDQRDSFAEFCADLLATIDHSRARRDSFGNLVPAEGPLAVANSVPAS